MAQRLLGTDSADPRLPASVTATETEVIAGAEADRAVDPVTLAAALPFVVGQSTGARPDVESGLELQEVIDNHQYVDSSTPLVRKVSLRAGNYPSNDALAAPNPVAIEGESSFGTRLQVGATFTPGDSLLNFVQTGASLILGDELHVPGYGLDRLGLHGNDRAVLAHGLKTDLTDRSTFRDVLCRLFKGSAYIGYRSQRESEWNNFNTWLCGSYGYPVIDLFDRGTGSDGHNLLRFTDCSFALSLGDHLRFGSGSAASVAREATFVGCTFHGMPDIYDGFGDSIQPDTVVFDDEGAHPCRVIVENGRFIELIGCRSILPGRGMPNILIAENATLGAATVNHLHISGGTYTARQPFQNRYVGTVSTALDTLSTLEFGVTSIERHHMSTGSKIQFIAGTLPAPLVALTDYYAIRVDQQFFKVATTRANAVAGTAIDLTTAGGASGTIIYTQYDQSVTAVDTATEVFTSADHRMCTEARIRFGTDGGSLPTGITAATDYFVIRVTKDTFKVATTRLNALAGTAVNVTAAGSAVYWIPQNFVVVVERGTVVIDGGPYFEGTAPRAIVKLESAGTAVLKWDSTTTTSIAGVPFVEDSTGANPAHVSDITGALRTTNYIQIGTNAIPLYGTRIGGAALGIANVSAADVIQLGDVTAAGVNTQVFGAAVTDLVVAGTTRVRATTGGAVITGLLQISAALDHDGTTVGFNGSTPVGKRTLGAAATDAATTQTLANNLRQALIDLGLGQT